MKSQRAPGFEYRPRYAQPGVAHLPDSGVTESANHSASALTKTGLALLSAQTVTWITSLIGVLIIPRVLGSSDFGVWAVANNIAIFLTAVCAFGTTGHAVKLVARDPDRARTIVAHALLLRFALWLLVMGTPLVAMGATGVAGQNLALIGVLFTSALMTTLGDAITSGLQGLYRMGRAQVALAVILLLSQFLLILCLLLGGGVIVLAWIALANAGCGVVIVGRMFFRGAPIPRRFEFGVLRDLATGGMPFLAWTLAQLTYATLPVAMLGAIGGSDAAGEYFFAWRLATIPIFIGTIVTQTTFPALADSAHRDREYFSRLLTQGTRLTIIFVLPMSVGLAVLAPYVAPTIGGDSFSDAASVIRLIGAMVSLACLGTVLGTGLMSLDKQRAWAIAGWCAAALCLALNAVLIPLCERFTETAANGTAAAAVATEFFMVAMAWRMVGWNLDRKAVLKTLTRTLIACAAMAVAASIAYEKVHPLAAVPVGMLAYPVAAVLAGVVSPSEMRRFSKYVRPSKEAAPQPVPLSPSERKARTA